MTDAGSKHLKIGEGVEGKSHICKRFDADNLMTMTKIDAKIGLRGLIAKSVSLMEPFFGGKYALLKPIWILFLNL